MNIIRGINRIAILLAVIAIVPGFFIASGIYYDEKNR
jgi:hypothetical protein